MSKAPYTEVAEETVGTRVAEETVGTRAAIATVGGLLGVSNQSTAAEALPNGTQMSASISLSVLPIPN